MASSKRREGQAALKAEDDQEIDGHLIQSEVLRIEGSSYFMQGLDGKEVNL